jgi:hypothetical protein
MKGIFNQKKLVSKFIARTFRKLIKTPKSQKLQNVKKRKKKTHQN